MSDKKIKIWVEFTGKSVKALFDKQTELRMNTSVNKKNLGTVANILMNELIESSEKIK